MRGNESLLVHYIDWTFFLTFYLFFTHTSMLIERQDDESLKPHNFCPDKYALLYSKIVIAYGDTQY